MTNVEILESLETMFNSHPTLVILIGFVIVAVGTAATLVALTLALKEIVKRCVGTEKFSTQAIVVGMLGGVIPLALAQIYTPKLFDFAIILALVISTVISSMLTKLNSE